jgi:hypothetical protein
MPDSAFADLPVISVYSQANALDDGFLQPLAGQIPASQNRKFQPGQTTLTPGLSDELLDSKEILQPYLERHLSGDWGDVSETDGMLNDLALREHPADRVLSKYSLQNGVEFYIISYPGMETTAMLIEEY